MVDVENQVIPSRFRGFVRTADRSNPSYWTAGTALESGDSAQGGEGGVPQVLRNRGYHPWEESPEAFFAQKKRNREVPMRKPNSNTFKPAKVRGKDFCVANEKGWCEARWFEHPFISSDLPASGRTAPRRSRSSRPHEPAQQRNPPCGACPAMASTWASQQGGHYAHLFEHRPQRPDQG